MNLSMNLPSHSELASTNRVYLQTTTHHANGALQLRLVLVRKCFSLVLATWTSRRVACLTFSITFSNRTALPENVPHTVNETMHLHIATSYGKQRPDEIFFSCVMKKIAQFGSLVCKLVPTSQICLLSKISTEQSSQQMWLKFNFV